MSLSKLDQFRADCLRSTVFTCRELLGMNYDEGDGGKRTNIGIGGIVPTGKHREICDMLDSETRFKLVIAPRESRKSSILQGYTVRQILLNPNIRIFYVARTDAMARDKVLAVRRQLESENVRDVFGDQVGTPWEEMRFTVKTRTNTALMNATVQGFSMDSMPVGGRANIVIVDDFIDDTNCTSADMVRKSKEKYAHLQPFVAKGGILIVVGTRWADDDLYGDIIESKNFRPPTGSQIVCGAGVRVIKGEDGQLDLEEESSGVLFQHLTLDYLRQKLHGMAIKGESDLFLKQYLNETGTGSGTSFQRWQFQPIEWGDDMSQLSGYVVTDTAISLEDEGCYSVIGYVGLDATDHLYLLDLRVGHWQMSDFVAEFFDVMEFWQHRVNHVGELWEEVALATAFRDAIRYDARSRKIRTHTITTPRTSRSHKGNRINRLHHPMMGRRFWVCDTVPRTFQDLDGTKVLWDPKGFYDSKTDSYLPSGELVDEFIRKTSKKDIPDALAMMLEDGKDRRGQMSRLCKFKNPPPRKEPSSLTEMRRDAYHQQEYQSTHGGDWWDKLFHEQGF